MMDEAEEEALFAQLRSRLRARPAADGEPAAAARIEARVESAVARRTAELRADLDRLAEHVAGLRQPVAARRRWAVPLLALAILIAGGIAAWMRLDGDTIANSLAGWGAVLFGQAR